MNKAIPWNVKGVGFDAREAARAAAKRAGLSVGHWLDSVITERATELGVAVADISADERLDALVARLAGAADSPLAAHAGAAAEAPACHTAAPLMARAAAAAQALKDDDLLGLENDLVVSSRRVANGAARSYDSVSTRSSMARATVAPQREDSMADWDNDSMLDQALALVEKRVRSAGDAMPGARQAMTAAAFAREADRAEAASEAQQPIAVFEDRLAGWERRKAQARKAAAPRAITEAVGSVAERLEQIENRIAQRDAELANKPIVAALSRLEDRFEHLLKRNSDGARETARVEATFRDIDQKLADFAQKLERKEAAPSKSHAEIERIDARLASLLARMEPSAAREGVFEPQSRSALTPAAAHTDAVSLDRKSRRDAIADIAQRQADLDLAPRHRDALLREASYPSIGQAHRERRPTEKTEPGSDDLGAFTHLQGAFATLSDRLEAHVERVALAGSGEDLTLLKSGIVGLEQRLDMLLDRKAGEPKDADSLGNVAVLREEIASLSRGLAELAAQQSASTLDQAVRTLNERMATSRLDGVGEAVLAPIERLSGELRAAFRETDPRAAIGGLEQQIGLIRQKVEGLEVRDLDATILTDIQAQTRELRDLVKAATGQVALGDRIEQEFLKLGARIDKLADTPPRAAIRDLELATNEIRMMLIRQSSTGIFEELSQKLDRLGERMGEVEERMALPAALFDDLSRRIDEAHDSLAAHITSKAANAVDLRPIEAMIGGLSGKLDGLRHNTVDMQALGGLVRGLAAQIEEARLPNADAKVLDTLESQVGRLADRLDRSDASLTAISSLERLIGELFHQVEETRTATIDAAENAARSAAQDTLRVTLAAPAGSAQVVVEQVSQELSELRQSQAASEKRVHGTLLALNQTLERMVDRLVKDSQASTPRSPLSEAAAAVATVPKLESGRPGVDRKAATNQAAALAEALVSKASELDPEKPIEQPELKRSPVAVKTTAPAVEIGRAMPGEPMPDVSPLIAAARRAAQAAQASAQASSKGPEGRTRLTVPVARTSKSLFSVFGRNRRPLLLGLAGIVLLLGTLQMVRLSGGAAGPTSGATDKSAAMTAAAPTSDSVTDDTAVPAKTTTSLLAGAATPAAVPTPAGASTAPTLSGAALKADPTLAGLPAGLLDLAANADVGAQFEIGVRLSEGRGVTRNLKAAATWFERAAQKGLAPAQYRIGSLYEKGIGVAADPALAVSWYQRAAEQGNVRAMHNLAVMSAEGSGGKPDYAKAATWFNKAAELGVRDSQFNLAILDARGLGVAQDMPQAYTWFAIAASQGDADAAKKRDDVGGKLDAKALAAAKVAADTFKPAVTDRAANDVAPPPGGWDSVTTKAAPGTASADPKAKTM